MSAPATPAAAATPREEQTDPQERSSEEREAYDYWGYLFKPDKTGTDKLKALLRGLKDFINLHYDPSDQPDLTPNQLAHFYRELHGNYDQLFLGTPNESIAFIYKSLGCLHSLQPQSFAHSTAFTDPTVPALKTEGWIMWQTIQLLLGPEEHAGFITEAVQKWDVKDPGTGETFPKILPRECFPLKPDKHMVAWYEGVSERLRREAEDEERQREIEAERAETRRIHDRVQRDDATDDADSVDSRGPALAYFRNPLYRHIDGRPSIVRKNSKRPAISPRPTMMNKGKEAASTMGNVIRNIGSPHLWDGRASTRPESRSRDREHRRRSLPDDRNHHYPGDPPPGTEGGFSPGEHRHRRPRSSQNDRPGTAPPEDDDWEEDEDPVYSPRPSPHHHHHPNNRPYSRDGSSSLRHSRSHEPTPSQKEGADYFAGFDDPNRRRNSAYEGTPTPTSGNDSSTTGTATGSGIGGGFAPSASPLFATHVARQPQPPPQPRLQPRPQSLRRAQDAGRPYSRSPDRRPDYRRDEPPPPQHHGSRRYNEGSPRRPRFEQSPAGYDYDDGAAGSSVVSGRPGSAVMEQGGYQSPAGVSRRRSGRISGSEVGGGGGYSGAEDGGGGRRGGGGRPKQTRFANGPSAPSVSGVDGRRYPAETPWR